MSPRPRRDIEFPPKDAALRDDVRELGALVGEVIREQAGEEVFEEVETCRLSSIGSREGDRISEEDLTEVIGSLSPSRAETLVRGFSTYFQVVNLAEKVHRIRRRRDYLRHATEPQSGSFADTFAILADAGLSMDDARHLVERLRIEPVLTAHPTEVTRAAILQKQQRIAQRLVERLDPSMTPPERRACNERIRAEVTSGWQTEEFPDERPEVTDEMEQVLFYLSDVLYRIVPPFYEDLQEAFVAAYGEEARSWHVPPVLRFSSWVGGDMDGNPNVTAATIREALTRQRALVLGLYRREVMQLGELLTQTPPLVSIAPEVASLLEQYRSLFPGLSGSASQRHRDMPYRILLSYMAARLEAAAGGSAGCYRNPAEFLQDLGGILQSLEGNKGSHAGAFGVRRLMRRCETFGFHLASLDVRQDAGVFRDAAGRLLDQSGWNDLETGDRMQKLSEALESPARAWPDSPADTAVRETFEAIASCRSRFGEGAVGPCILSMTHEAEDLLSALYLARCTSLGSKEGKISLDIAPLFETVHDLEQAPRVMKALMDNSVYRRHLEGRGNRQMVMIGYSDSNKESGFAASRWALYRAQSELCSLFSGTGVELNFFHGRGGTISRGGSRTPHAVMSAPPGAVGGRLRQTEQGEAINARYGLRSIAMRTLELATSTVVAATAWEAPPPDEEEGREVMRVIASASRDAFRRLVYEDKGFIEYFRLATPIDVIERMPIGSRPARRGTQGGIESLRAIPWVFSWTQSRHYLPGWYGLGAGLEAATEKYGSARVERLARDWPLLRSMLQDAEVVLAKADLTIARRYAGLAGDSGRRYFDIIRKAYRTTVSRLLDLAGRHELLEDNLTLRRSIRLRNPYVDPMSLLQVSLLERWRSTDRSDDEILRALRATVHGIARGLQGTG